jgi:effector-binding domain-containing protein
MSHQLPEVKEIKPINFLFHRVETTVSNLANHVPVAKALFKEAVNLDLHPTGPVHWHYIGFTDPSRSFTLEICLPVGSIPSDYDGEFHFKRTGNFKSVSLLHEGAWSDLYKSYDLVFQFINEHQHQPVGVSRELYINADFADPQANVTEIQMGIK